MEWMQVLTIIVAAVGSTYFFYLITAERINRMEDFYRQHMNRMDDKWERLFEKLLIQEKDKIKN
jgi:hypothetical protein